MTDATAPATNFGRLAQQLKAGSLAARLVDAHIAASPATQEAALKTVITDRLNELRQAYAAAEDQ
jgi:hypothetical protein